LAILAAADPSPKSPQFQPSHPPKTIILLAKMQMKLPKSQGFRQLRDHYELLRRSRTTVVSWGEGSQTVKVEP